MPRNSSGTYTLPSGNPVSSGTLIEASWANTTLSDLASAMTNSLSRGGEGGMTAALRLFDGTVSLPGLAFTNETSTGLYRAGSGDMRLAVTGSQVMQFLTTGVAVTGTLSASGNFAINTDKFTVAASSGNTVVAGTLGVTGNVAVNTDKFTVAASSGNTAVAGTLAVTGASTFSGQTNTFENSTAYYPQLINRNKTADANGSYIVLEKVRNTSVVQNGDVLGNVIFRGYDGTQYLQGAYINALVSAAPGTNDMPTDLVFGTTADGGAGPSERMRITQAGNVGIGTASPGSNRVYISAPDGTAPLTLDSAGGSDSTRALNFNIAGSNYGKILVPSGSGGAMAFWTGGAGAAAERMRIDSSGNVGIGTSSISEKLRVQNTTGVNTTFTNNVDADVKINLTSGVSLISPSTGILAFGTSNTERARIDSDGNLLVGKTAVNITDAGQVALSTGRIWLTTSANDSLTLNRLTNDGVLAEFRQNSTIEGSISVSGTTVSYNGGHLSRYAQTTTAKDESLVKGTVLSNLDEMNVYTDADGNPVENEQLNKVKVSDVEGDANVAGVFVNWTYDDAHEVDEINMAMTGDMIIRIAQGVTVSRGDLLMSAGDGTAKPQGDDIVRSKTIAKVTSTHVTCTYEDGSFCVPCVLMAC